MKIECITLPLLILIAASATLAIPLEFNEAAEPIGARKVAATPLEKGNWLQRQWRKTSLHRIQYGLSKW